ncbi:UNKNOWN [Stylonychia lemnae]|uniref:Thioredoxin-like fold n=1 Tax=Stylonychia lemnae TaxID=5949 RepID=A0A078AA29_STYLE|nr:UNKNOWN [Stylonychia lemnae]|eukprot:CDW79125.1 UNKNOWN [Stylonychia lemnae]
MKIYQNLARHVKQVKNRISILKISQAQVSHFNKQNLNVYNAKQEKQSEQAFHLNLNFRDEEETQKEIEIRKQYLKNSYDSEKLINLIKKYIGKSNGKFSLALIDVNAKIEINSEFQSVQPMDVPTTYLMYKGSTTIELRGYPSKIKLKELLKSAVFLYQVTNEENLINQLIKEGKQCMDDQNFNDALYLFNEANQMNQWRNLYGSTIISNLAYIQTKRGNMAAARQHIDEYYQIFGKETFDKQEEEHLTFVKFELDQDDYQKQNKEVTGAESINLDQAKKFYLENDYDNSLKQCMELLKQNFDNFEAHVILQRIQVELGSENPIVVESRNQIKEMLLRAYSNKII